MDSSTTSLYKENKLVTETEGVDNLQLATVGQRPTPDSCRETLRINHEEQSFHHHLTLGIQEKLQKNRMIKNVKMQFCKPLDKQAVGHWERKNGVTLPSDLKDYYQSTNGFKLTWSLEHAGDVLPIGEININPLHQLVKIHAAAKQSLTGTNSGSRGGALGLGLSTRPRTCSADSSQRHSLSSAPMSASSRNKLHTENGHIPDQGPDSMQLPFSELEQTMVGSAGFAKLAISGLTYSPDNKMFILDSGRSGWGKVCLVYPSPPSSASPSPSQPSTPSGRKTPLSNRGPYVEIWFMDPSFQWHFLAPTFTHFYRMLLFHLGLPQWHYRFTPFGLSSWAEQMFWLVAPHLLQSPKLSRFPSMYHGEGLWCTTDLPSEAATPNSTVNALSNQLFRRKKKDKEKYQN